MLILIFVFAFSSAFVLVRFIVKMGVVALIFRGPCPKWLRTRGQLRTSVSGLYGVDMLLHLYPFA